MIFFARSYLRYLRYLRKPSLQGPVPHTTSTCDTPRPVHTSATGTPCARAAPRSTYLRPTCDSPRSPYLRPRPPRVSSGRGSPLTTAEQPGRPPSTSIQFATSAMSRGSTDHMNRVSCECLPLRTSVRSMVMMWACGGCPMFFSCSITSPEWLIPGATPLPSLPSPQHTRTHPTPSPSPYPTFS